MDDSPPVSTLAGLLDVLTRIEERLTRIERRLDRAEPQGRALEQLPNVVAVAADTLDQHAAQLQARGIDLEQRAQTALELLERITEPSTAKAISGALELAEQVPNVIAMLTDSLDARAAALSERFDLSQRAVTLARLAERITSPSALAVLDTLLDHLPSLEQLLGAGLLGPGPIDIVSRAGQALSRAQQTAPRAFGMFGLLRALSDHDVQHSLGFAITFASEFGRSITPGDAQRALPSTAPSTDSHFKQ